MSTDGTLPPSLYQKLVSQGWYSVGGEPMTGIGVIKGNSRSSDYSSHIGMLCAKAKGLGNIGQPTAKHGN